MINYIRNFSCINTGFYCPEQSLCIIPCPSGAYCVMKTKKLENPAVSTVYIVCDTLK